MSINLAGKKLLILGGAFQHRKVVETAKKMGIITYVTDYLDIKDSPAKQIADNPYMYDINDINKLYDLCKKENIDGIVAPYLDITQKPYQVLCERLNYSCFGNLEQHKILTNKSLFKRFCEKHGADVIPYYREEEITDLNICKDKVKFPILIKPCDSRGSRGQTICYSRNEAIKAIHFAKLASPSENVVIEKYMGTENDLQLVYLVIEGEPILVRVEDRYMGDKSSGLDKLAIASIEPSIHEQKYREEVDGKIVSMIKKLKLRNSPVFIQGFMDGNTVRLYDPGIRLPGDEYDTIYKSITGIDLTELVIKFALTGEMSKEIGKKIKSTRIEKATAMLYLALRPGKIIRIEGIDEINKNPYILSMSQLYREGDIVRRHNNVQQRFGECDIECEDFRHLKDTIEWIYSKLHVFDENNEDMIFARFDTKLLEKYR